MTEKRYPYAAKGLRLLFWARLLGLLVPAAMNQALIQMRSAAMREDGALYARLFYLDSNPLWRLLPALLFGLLGLLALSIARKENTGYAIALWLALGSLVAKVVRLFLPQTALIPAILLSLTENLLELGVLLLLCLTTAFLLHQLGRERLMEWGLGTCVLCTLLSLMAIVSPIGSVLSGTLPATRLADLTLGGSQGTIVLLVYLFFLWRSATALRKGGKAAPEEKD